MQNFEKSKQAHYTHEISEATKCLEKTSKKFISNFSVNFTITDKISSRSPHLVFRCEQTRHKLTLTNNECRSVAKKIFEINSGVGVCVRLVEVVNIWVRFLRF